MAKWLIAALAFCLAIPLVRAYINGMGKLWRESHPSFMPEIDAIGLGRGLVWEIGKYGRAAETCLRHLDPDFDKQEDSGQSFDIRRASPSDRYRLQLMFTIAVFVVVVNRLSNVGNRKAVCQGFFFEFPKLAPEIAKAVGSSDPPKLEARQFAGELVGAITNNPESVETLSLSVLADLPLPVLFCKLSEVVLDRAITGTKKLQPANSNGLMRAAFLGGLAGVMNAALMNLDAQQSG